MCFHLPGSVQHTRAEQIGLGNPESISLVAYFWKQIRGVIEMDADVSSAKAWIEDPRKLAVSLRNLVDTLDPYVFPDEKRVLQNVDARLLFVPDKVDAEKLLWVAEWFHDSLECYLISGGTQPVGLSLLQEVMGNLRIIIDQPTTLVELDSWPRIVRTLKLIEHDALPASRGETPPTKWSGWHEPGDWYLPFGMSATGWRLELRTKWLPDGSAERHPSAPTRGKVRFLEEFLDRLGVKEPT